MYIQTERLNFSGDVEIQLLKERLLETEKAMAKIVEQMQQGIIKIDLEITKADILSDNHC